MTSLGESVGSHIFFSPDYSNRVGNPCKIQRNPNSHKVSGRISMLRVLLYGLLFMFGSTCVAQFTYAPIDVPGATATVARGINNSGEIVGFYQTTVCSNYDLNVPSCPTLGFKYINNTYTTVVVPNSIATAVNGVNDLGDMVGFYTKADGSRHGFIWWHTGMVQTIDAPKTPYPTIVMGINKSGV